MGRNTLVADHFNTSSSHDPSSFRVVWTGAPLDGSSKLFHRWLMVEEAPNAKQHCPTGALPSSAVAACIEHVNDIPLDCRRANLRSAPDRVHNNIWTHRLVRTFRDGSLHATAQAMEAERVRYTGILSKLPPLPDCVFANKVRRDRPVGNTAKRVRLEM